MPRVAVIYLLYNGRQYLADCFASLEAMNYPAKDAEIFVIDNGSSDDGLIFFKNEILPKSGTKLSKINLIENKENLGFAEGNNIGMRLALEAGFDYIYLLNQDTEVDPNFIFETVKLAEEAKSAGSIQSLILLHDNKTTVNSFGNAIHFLGFGYARGYGMNLSDVEKLIAEKISFEKNFKIAYGSGAGVLYRASALSEMGLFDKELFLYHEDLDLGWRLRLAGYENILAPRSWIYHKYEFSRSIKKYYWMERNRFMVMFKLYKLPTLLLLAPALLAAEAGLLLFSLRSGWFEEKIKGYKYFLSLNNWKNLLKARQMAQKARKKSDCEIVDLFTPAILFQDFKNPFVLYFVNPLLILYWVIARAFIFW
ncbi:glycosyltransferase family 2 protein [Candidatus Uhrbacteria bacterium]|nr:glycosyltransferase family 2 protein [Candidatus Uhrbacteria bacterium]